jgi:hypothetical protein
MIAGIIGVGTYYSPWFPYTIASIYPICDKIVVVNAGFDLKNPDKNNSMVPVEQYSKDIKMLDVCGRIIELKNFDANKMIPSTEIITQNEANSRKMVYGWMDQRGRNITIASQEANKIGASYILKIDSDQYLDESCIGINPRENGYTFYQYEVKGDAEHLSPGQENSHYNDSVFLYQAKKGQYYGGGGGPAISADRQHCRDRICFHARFANPPGIGRSKQFGHFYGRFWFSLMTNSGLWGRDLEDLAQRNADAAMSVDLSKLETIGLADVVSNGPERYIEMYT